MAASQVALPALATPGPRTALQAAPLVSQIVQLVVSQIAAMAKAELSPTKKGPAGSHPLASSASARSAVPSPVLSLVVSQCLP